MHQVYKSSNGYNSLCFLQPSSPVETGKQQPGPRLRDSLRVKPRKLYRLLLCVTAGLRFYPLRGHMNQFESSAVPNSGDFSLMSSALCSTSEIFIWPNLTQFESIESSNGQGRYWEFSCLPSIKMEEEKKKAFSVSLISKVLQDSKRKGSSSYIL